MDFPQLLEAHYWKLSDEAGETIMRFYRSHPKTNGTIQIVCSAACVRLCVTIARIASHAIPTDRVNAIAFKNISSNGSIWRHEEIGLAVSFGFDAVAPVLGKQRKRGKKKRDTSMGGFAIPLRTHGGTSVLSNITRLTFVYSNRSTCGEFSSNYAKNTNANNLSIPRPFC